MTAQTQNNSEGSVPRNAGERSLGLGLCSPPAISQTANILCLHPAKGTEKAIAAAYRARRQVRTKQLELSMDAINVSDEDVYCDKTRLNQVLLNLMSNAIKFTPAGGTQGEALRTPPERAVAAAPYAGNLRKFWGECSKMAKMMHLHSRG